MLRAGLVDRGRNAVQCPPSPSGRPHLSRVTGVGDPALLRLQLQAMIDLAPVEQLLKPSEPPHAGDSPSSDEGRYQNNPFVTPAKMPERNMNVSLR
jgi:hypothetical protein